MRSRERTVQRARRRRALVLLAAAAALLGAGGAIPAQAQDGGEVITGDTLFGAYELEARGTGVQGRYEIEGLLPGGSPLLDLTIPESLARFGSGPTGYGLASLAYPGGLLVNLPSLLAQTGQTQAADSIPPYPIKAEAFFPTGPVDAQNLQAGGVQQVHSSELGVEVLSTYSAIEAAPVLHVDSISSASRSSIEDGSAVARTRVVLGGVDLLGGLITIESLVTDLVAAHDGEAGAVDGGTSATGVRFLGLAASLTEEGLVLDKAPPVAGPGAPLSGALDPLLEPLQQATAPVQDLLEQVLQQAVPSVDEALAAAGIDLSLLTVEQIENEETGAAAFAAAGLRLALTYEGKEQAALQDLIDSIPEELRPGLGPIPSPIAFLTENHITGLSLAQGTVTALASPPFDINDLPSADLVSSGGDLPSFDAGTLGSPGFATPTPQIPEAAGPGGFGEAAAALAGSAIPAALLIILLLASPLFGVASTRLADNVLAPVATSCPQGLDEPPSPTRQP
jgi:hypothetical protein